MLIPSSRATFVVPTRVGALVLGDDGPQGTYAAAAGVISVAVAGGGIMLLGRQDAIDLGGGTAPTCAALGAALSRLPPAIEVLRALDHGDGRASLTLTTTAGRAEVLLDCADLAAAAPWTIPLDLSGRNRLAARLGWPSDSPLIALAVADGQLRFGLAGRDDLAATTALPGALLAIMADPAGKTAFVLTESDLLAVDLDRAVSAIVARDGIVAVAPLAQTGPAPAPTRHPPRPRNLPPRPPPRAPAPAPVPAPSAPQAGVPAPVAPATTLAAPPATITGPPLDLTVERVRRIQTALVVLGFRPGAVDGIMGERTRDALDRWRARQGLPTDAPLTTHEFLLLIAEAAL